MKQQKMTSFFKPDVVMPLCVVLVTECGRPFSIFDDAPMKELIRLGRKSTKEEESLVVNATNVREAVLKEYKELKNKLRGTFRGKIVSLSADMATCQQRCFIGNSINLS